MRRDGSNMSEESLLDALSRLKNYFSQTLPEGAIPQIVFHGAEPLLNRDAVFAGIEQYKNDFRFGLQTNATVLDDEAVEFLISREVSIGISLDAPTAASLTAPARTGKDRVHTRRPLKLWKGLRAIQTGVLSAPSPARTCGI